jgi:hypothetical protein
MTEMLLRVAPRRLPATFLLLATMGALFGARAPAAAQAPPRTIVWRAEALQQTKNRLVAGDPSLAPALAALKTRAEDALEAGPFSVMDKERVPPSGDKHDYISFGPYWWPDPARPDGLPYIRRDGETNPESRTDSDRPRLGSFMDAVETLAVAYYFTDDEKYAEHAARLLRIWFLDPATRMNPNLNHGQAIPGRVDGRGIGIIDTRGLSTLVDALTLVSRSPHWSAADREGMRSWFRDYLEWLQTSEHGVDERDEHNNHGTWYDAQVVALALFVGEDSIARRVLEEHTKARIDAHIRADGSQPHELARTRSLSYSVMNLEGFLRLAEMGRHVGVDLWRYSAPGGGTLRAAIDYLAPYTDPQNRWDGQQITPANPIEQLPGLRMASLAYGDARYEEAIDRIPDQERVAAHRAQLLHPVSR